MSQREAPIHCAEFVANLFDRRLDGLPFLLTRPQTPSPVVSISQLGTYLPVISVSARPWTIVTDDDEFTSQLISLFFTWEQPWYTYVEMNSFLDDMKSGTYNSSSGPPPEREFCSSSLVNAIMAMGCVSCAQTLRCRRLSNKILAQFASSFGLRGTWRSQHTRPSLLNRSGKTYST